MIRSVLTPVLRANLLYLGLAALLFAAGTAALVIADPFRRRPAYADIVQVAAAESEGRVRVDWNPNHPVVQRADRALLRVRDGQAMYEYPVDKAVLQRGGLDYLRKSGDVSLSLLFFRGAEAQGHAAVRALAGPPVPRQ
jgi:hypothetical protein